MTSLDKFFSNKNWERDNDGEWSYIGETNPLEAAAELEQLRVDIERLNKVYQLAVAEEIKATEEINLALHSLNRVLRGKRF